MTARTRSFVSATGTEPRGAIVIERGILEVVGVEIKPAATVFPSDFRGLRKLKSTPGSRFAGGVVLYEGETCASIGDGLYAVPIRALWES